MLELIHTTRRSASHGALNRSYSSTSDSLHRPRRAHSRQQLRSVNENTSLLAFPGPLESMLKTTTETGDIGLFSIRPVRSSGNDHAPSSSPRPGYGETPPSRRPNGEGMRSCGLRDDRRWLPSHRDTTSEIISMCGSDSLRSASSAFTHPYNDMGNRSYSIATCSSRRPPSHKPSGDMQSQQHEGFSQRPRSPFPYPTRLKRPGVRPASPALTENGAVDYSRMVGIDRVSRRTVHGSYKPTYPQYGSRQIPRLRTDGTSSSESFSNYSVADNFSVHSGMSPLSLAPWGHHYRGRLGSSASEHSLRNSSLTSILNMCQRPTCGPPTRNPSLRVQPTGTFYYDYSEDFDYTVDSPPPLPDSASDIATPSTSVNQSRVIEDEPEPISQGLVKYHSSPSGPRLHSEEKLPSSSLQSQISEGFDSPSLGDRQNAQHVPRQASKKQSSSSADVLKEDSPRSEPEPSPFPVKGGVNSQGSFGDEVLAGSRGAGMTSSPRCHDEEWGVGTAVVPRRQNASLTVRSHMRFSSPRSVRVVPSRSYEENMRRLATSPPKASSRSDSAYRSLPAHYRERRVPSSPRGQTHRNTAFPIGFGYSELASTEDGSGATASTDTQDGFLTSEDSLGQHTTVFAGVPDQIQDANMGFNSPKPAPDAEQHFFGDPVVQDYKSRSHKRNSALPAIDTNELQNLAGSEIGTIVDRSRTPMLAPHPISPARQFRLQNSVPQLMKSLPPLPGISVRSDSCMADFSSQDLEYIMGFPTPAPSRFGDEQTTTVGPMFRHDSNQKEPRLKMPFSPVVKSPLVHTTAADEPGNNDAHADQREQSRRSGSRNSSGNSKLRLKVSRGSLKKMHAEGIGGRRNTVAGPTGEWSGPAGPKLRGQPSMSYLSPGLANMECLVESAGETEKTDTRAGEDAFIDSPFTSTPAPAIPVGHQDHCEDKPSPPTQEPGEVTIPTARSEEARGSLLQDSCAGGKSPRELKKRFPELRTRLAECRLRSGETLTPGGRIGEVTEVVNIPPLEAPMTESGDGSRVDSTRKDGDGDDNASDEKAGKHQSGGFRGRMSRWFKAAREVVMGACGGSGKRGG